MAPDRLYLKDDVDPAGAARSLKERIREAGNLASMGAGPDGRERLLDKYLQWVEDTEHVLFALTLDAEVVTML